ncbi:MAG: radical SAM protein [Acidimicrobiales bacterium]
MHEVIASPYPEGHIIVRPGSEGGLRIPLAAYAEIAQAEHGDPVPVWLANAVPSRWHLDLRGRPVGDTVLVRPETPYGYARASYELNFGCNYDCDHCYLGKKRFAGLDWSRREKLLRLMADAGVLWIQLTGGEPLMDRQFIDTHSLAYDIGMMIQISTNGSRLCHPAILEALTARRPYRVTVSIYGATAESYDGLTRRPGSFKRFMRGVRSAHDADLPLRFNIVVTKHNEHEVAAMQGLAESVGAPHFVYTNISPTIYGSRQVLATQSGRYPRTRSASGGCNAGVTHFHVDPHGVASICKVSRKDTDSVDLMAVGLEGLHKLRDTSDRLLARHDICTGCVLQQTCGTCMPMVNLYRQAKAPPKVFCQYGEEV